jgi:toxin YoeB
MIYEISFTPQALEDVKKLRKSGDKSTLKKLNSLMDELQKHPYSGTGKPKPLGQDR